MADRTFLGHAADIKPVATVTIANTWAQNDTVTLTIDSIDFVITIGASVTTANVATAVQQAYQGSTFTDTTASCSPSGGAQTIGQHAEFTATVSSAVVTFTGKTAGKPITMTATESTAGSGTATLSNTVTATGRSHFNQADNWSANTVPVDGDNILLVSGSTGLLYNLTPAIQPGTLTKYKSFTGPIGLAKTNKDASSESLYYDEYRDEELTFDDNAGATGTYNLEVGQGPGSKRIRINTGAGASIFNVYGAGGRETTGVPTTLLRGTNSANILNNFAGDVAMGFYGESFTLATIKHGNGTQSTAYTYLGTGATLTGATIEVNGGTLVANTAIATSSGGITIYSGEFQHFGGNIGGTLSIFGGTFKLLSQQDVTFSGTVKVYNRGIFDMSQYQHAATFSNDVELYDKSEFRDPNSSSAANTDWQKDESATLIVGSRRVLRKVS